MGTGSITKQCSLFGDVGRALAVAYRRYRFLGIFESAEVARRRYYRTNH